MVLIGRFFIVAASVAGLCGALALPETTPADLHSTPADLLHPLAARGINCQGNSFCSDKGINNPGVPTGTPMALWMFQNMIAYVPDSHTYTQGQQFMCSAVYLTTQWSEGFCGFLQKTGSTPVPAKYIKQALWDIYSHGCGRCGSSPFRDTYPGFITINWTDSVNCPPGLLNNAGAVCRHCNGQNCVGKYLGN